MYFLLLVENISTSFLFELVYGIQVFTSLAFGKYFSVAKDKWNPSVFHQYMLVYESSDVRLWAWNSGRAKLVSTPGGLLHRFTSTYSFYVFMRLIVSCVSFYKLPCLFELASYRLLVFTAAVMAYGPSSAS